MRKRSSFLSGRYRSEIIGLICRIGKRNQELIQVNFRCRVNHPVGVAVDSISNVYVVYSGIYWDNQVAQKFAALAILSLN